MPHRKYIAEKIFSSIINRKNFGYERKEERIRKLLIIIDTWILSKYII